MLKDTSDGSIPNIHKGRTATIAHDDVATWQAKSLLYIKWTYAGSRPHNQNHA